MTPQEHLEWQRKNRRERFEKAIQTVLNRGEHPSGARIRDELGLSRYKGDGNLGSVETQWRREYLVSLGWTREDKLSARWKPPGGHDDSP